VWNRSGVTTANGKLWRPGALKGVLRNPRMAGYRMITIKNSESSGQTLTKHPIVLLDAEGKPVIGQWEPMITPEQWAQLIAIIGDTPRRGDGHNTRAHLLTGTLRCGKQGCDMPLRAVKAPASANKPAGFFWYGCPSRGMGGCGGVKIDGGKADEAVIHLALAMFEQQANKRDARVEPQEWAREGELTRVHEDMTALKAARRATPPRISAQRYYADLADLENEERTLLREKNALIRATRTGNDIPATLTADWLSGTLTLTEQRMYIERAFSAVTVAPALGKRGIPIHERLTPVPTRQQ
jgi:hypothetical protein